MIKASGDNLYWLQQLHIYRGLVERHQRLQFLKSLLVGGVLVAILNLFFMMRMAPHTDFWVNVPAFLLPVMLLVLPWVSHFLRRARKKKNDLARRFFYAGLQVDEEGRRLQTNAAHPELVACLDGEAAQHQVPVYD
ncbi:hypothetical protein [Marinospirillum perlucidum]|uniref:hypothetical protein n=1 Tax=Marinospirillum perlucidum TaxID=1982602 RepID=UPI000DF44656|nr:hypothetical protein [Marinospirillum perlucidum]